MSSGKKIGHPVRKKKKEMNTKKQILILTMTAMLLVPTLPAAMEVRQKMYRFRMNVIQDIACTTFVIDKLPQFRKFPTLFCRLPVVYFALDSAVLSPSAAETILSDLKRCGVMQKEPLVVTGHTCGLGPDQVNRTLSLQRAKVVAGFLRNRGFNVATVQGKGSQNPITRNSQEFFRNRRVKIEIIH